MKVGDETKEVCTALCWADGQEIIERDVRRLDIVSLSRQVDLLSFFLSFFPSFSIVSLPCCPGHWSMASIENQKEEEEEKLTTGDIL